MIKFIKDVFDHANKGNEGLSLWDKIQNTVDQVNNGYNYKENHFMSNKELDEKLYEGVASTLVYGGSMILDTYANRYMLVKKILPDEHSKQEKILTMLNMFEEREGKDFKVEEIGYGPKLYLLEWYFDEEENRSTDFDKVKQELPFEMYKDHVLAINEFIQENREDRYDFGLGMTMFNENKKLVSETSANFRICKIIDDIKEEADYVRTLDPTTQNHKNSVWVLEA